MGGISVWGKLRHSIQIGPKNTRSVYGVLNIQYQKANVCLLLTIVCYVFNVSISGKKWKSREEKFFSLTFSLSHVPMYIGQRLSSIVALVQAIYRLWQFKRLFLHYMASSYITKVKIFFHIFTFIFFNYLFFIMTIILFLVIYFFSNIFNMLV